MKKVLLVAALVLVAMLSARAQAPPSVASIKFIVPNAVVTTTVTAQGVATSPTPINLGVMTALLADVGNLSKIDTAVAAILAKYPGLIITGPDGGVIYTNATQ